MAPENREGNKGLRGLALPAVLDSSTHDLTTDFFEPVLSRSTSYDRGVGFFSASWLRINARGMQAFAEHGGHARWITSPILSEDDWRAMMDGAAARTDMVLRDALHRAISQLDSTLERETLVALAWLVADEVIDFKLAVPRDKLQAGEFHDKFGVFSDDEGQLLSFNGSYNDSQQGTRNYESIATFRSWEPSQIEYVEDSVRRFRRLWSNQDPNVQVYDLPDAARAEIVKLRDGRRPYVLPVGERGQNERVNGPRVPDRLSLRDYQREALVRWKENGFRGFFEMATGTGKTITALAATVTLSSEVQPLAIVIAVPYQHLVTQWSREASEFGLDAILAFRSTQSWVDELNDRIVEINAERRNYLCVITTHKTFSSQPFQQTLARLSAPTLLIADEAHHLGAEHFRKSLPHNAGYRLALSATPNRWFDDLGTAVLRQYFGETVFEFGLQAAIGTSLTRYYYYPHLVSLSPDEMEKYEALTAKIAQALAGGVDDSNPALAALLRKRSRLLNTAAAKLEVLDELLAGDPALDHTIIYCAPGQIDEALILAGVGHGVLIRRFTARENAAQREVILADFAAGRIQALAAMKCLDEGVDVPSTRQAYFLASSGNPMEFIQRRGRILRRYAGKEYSVIHDLVAVPPEGQKWPKDSSRFRAERGIVRKELARFAEFADLAENKYEARDAIWSVAKRYDLTDF